MDNDDEVPLSDDLAFALEYSYPSDQARGFTGGSGTLMLPVSGDLVMSDALPVGAELTLSEPNLPNVPGATWGEPVIDPLTLTIEAGGVTASITVTNTITQDVGGFSVTKTISGDGASLVPENAVFTVGYEYEPINGFSTSRETGPTSFPRRRCSGSTTRTRSRRRCRRNPPRAAR
ncbi:DUF5979 domain-containing protein [Microbacterium amylolyticum]|uniref:DUF5979 domain-containing protein n=1 Tax=Microbacterium amylolyticum TaxID=936337 RepID=A0ABS4ZI06_9MICO|nr:DUF5979 domain-containing protein [Microbacterium amylolyticum]MBP2436909.1 hypothetical protein [Microbacterium amylolyticum]